MILGDNALWGRFPELYFGVWGFFGVMTRVAGIKASYGYGDNFAIGDSRQPITDRD
jgi:hypothetical protein